MAEHRNMRASDADRAQIANLLRCAMAEGRLLDHELDDRLGKAFHARTYGELNAIVADLPRGLGPQNHPARAGTALRPRPALIAMAAVVVVLLLASLTVTGVGIQRARERPPLPSIPTGVASSGSAQGVLTPGSQ